MSHTIEMETREYGEGRYALSWDELKEIDRKHVVACHTRSHIPIEPLDAVRRESEVVGSQRDFVEHLGHPVRTFVSFGGPAYGGGGASDRLIEKAGYQFVFSNLKVQRLRDRA